MSTVNILSWKARTFQPKQLGAIQKFFESVLGTSSITISDTYQEKAAINLILVYFSTDSNPSSKLLESELMKFSGNCVLVCLGQQLSVKYSPPHFPYNQNLYFHYLDGEIGDVLDAHKAMNGELIKKISLKIKQEDSLIAYDPNSCFNFEYFIRRIWHYLQSLFPVATQIEKKKTIK